MAFRQHLSKIAILSAIIMGIPANMAFGQETQTSTSVEKSDSLTPDEMTILLRPSPLGDVVYGNPDAKVTIVEFSSITCSYCGEFQREVFPQLKEKYIDTGKVKVIFRDLAYDPFATGAYLLARCEGNEKFPGVVKHFFQNQKRIYEKNAALGELMKDLSLEAGIPKEKYLTCISDKRLLGGLKAVRDQAAELKISGTPTFFINGQRISGYIPFNELSAHIEKYLKQ